MAWVRRSREKKRARGETTEMDTQSRWPSRAGGGEREDKEREQLGHTEVDMTINLGAYHFLCCGCVLYFSSFSSSSSSSSSVSWSSSSCSTFCYVSFLSSFRFRQSRPPPHHLGTVLNWTAVTLVVQAVVRWLAPRRGGAAPNGHVLTHAMMLPLCVTKVRHNIKLFVNGLLKYPASVLLTTTLLAQVFLQHDVGQS
jgi:hypothetical protein